MQIIFFKEKNNSYKLVTSLTISILYLVCINLSFAKQSIEPDSLSNIDSTLIKIDNLRTNNPALSQKLLAKLETKISSLNEKQQYYLTYLSGWKSLYQGDYLLGEQKLSSLLTSNASSLIKFRANYSLVDGYASQQRWENGLQQVAKLLTTSVNIQDNKHYQTGLITVISFYNQVGQYQLALDYSEQLIDKTTDNRTACIVNQLVLLAKLKTSQLSDNIVDIPNGISLCELANEPLFTGHIRSYQAQLSLNITDADGAINALMPHLIEIESTNFKVLITLTYNLLAQAYQLKGDTENTKKYALLAHSQGNDLPLSKQLADTYQLLYQIAEQEGDFESALDFHKESSSATQKYLDETQAKQLAFQLANHNNFANKQQIEQQSQQIDLLNIQHLLTKKKSENSLLLILLLCSFLIALAIWIYRTWLTQQYLNQLAEVDSLTKVHSREHFIHLAESALKYCYRNKVSLTCILFDLDDFKKINDKCGHVIGDEVLKEVTRICGTIGRTNDILGRIGGEEFAYILPGCNLIIAEDIANQCRLGIQNIDYKLLGLHQPITASFGVSDCVVSGFELDSLLSDADSAMHASKEQGKNYVSVFT
jgi:diguanylate cyclase (GGDEF)-like protein